MSCHNKATPGKLALCIDSMFLAIRVSVMALTAGCVYCNVTRMSFAARCEQNLDRSDLGAGSSSMSSRKSLMTFVFCSHQIKLFSMQSRAYSKQNSLKKHHRALTSRNRCTQAVSGRQSITLKLNTANAVYLHNMHLTTKPLLDVQKETVRSHTWSRRPM